MAAAVTRALQLPESEKATIKRNAQTIAQQHSLVTERREFQQILNRLDELYSYSPFLRTTVKIGKKIGVWEV